MAVAARQRYTFDDYVELEELSPLIKHEYLDGQVWAMAGGSPDHAAIATNVSTSLNVQLRDRRRRVYNSDLRIRVQATGLATSPDVTVICDQLELDSEDRKGHTAVNPRVLVEVLSPSTEEYDRGEKLEHYKHIDSLQEVVLVAHDRRSIEVVRRAGGGWERTEYRDNGAVLTSLSCTLSIDDVHRDPLAPSH